MEFTVSKSDLLRELAFSQGVVEKKTTIPILANLLIEAEGDHIQLTATDLELGIHCSCPASVVQPGSGTIPAKRLLEYVRLLPDAEIRIKFLENQWASITCGRSRTRIAGMARESYPELPALPETSIKVPAATLRSMITQTMFAISSEETRFTLNGALLVLDASSMKMVATDGHRLAHVVADAQIEGLTEPQSALLPRKAMGELSKLIDSLGEDAELAFSSDDNHLFFQSGGRLLITRKLSGSFPDYERVLPKEQIYELPIAKDEIRSALERVSQFADDRTRAVKLGLGNGELKVHSSLTDLGDSEESIPAEYQGEPFDIGFNAAYLLDFLRAVGGDTIQFCFRDSQSAAEFRPGSSDGGLHYRYVVMPMRV